MLVDDDSIFNFISEKLIWKFDPSIVCQSFTDPRLAMDFLRKGKVDLILLDLNMPYMNGWAFLEEMSTSGIKTPVFILTSSILKEDKQRSLEYKMVKGYISKPLEKKHLEDIFAMNSHG